MLYIEMGQTQSQEVDTFVNNYVNTTSLSDVIQRYAQTTNAVTNNTQQFYLDIDARDISGNLKVFQQIASVIDMQQVVNRSNLTSLTNDIQQALTSELQAAVRRMTDGLGDLFSTPTNQRVRDEVINNMSTYVKNAVTIDDVSNLLLSSNNVQDQRIAIKARDITGNLIFDQKIQADITAKNMVDTVVNNILQNRDVQQLATLVTPKLESESESVISKGINQLGNIGASLTSGLIWFALAVVVLIVGILLAILLPVSKGWKIAIVVITIILVLIFGFLGARPILRI